jgi:LmbE family N-acetylglucosaminyl deacetylase
LAVILLVMRNGRTLVFVVAHPDDDAHAMAGTVALQAADPGFRYVLVHATDGGAGDIREEFPAGPSRSADGSRCHIGVELYASLRVSL